MNKAGKVALGIVCGLPLAGALLFGVGTSRAASTLRKQEAAARREGIPLTPADLNEIVRVPWTDNAAPIYQAAIKLEKSDLQISGALRVLKNAPLSKIAVGAPVPTQMAAVLPTLAPLLAKYEEGSRRSGCDWNRAWQKGFKLLFPEYASLKRASRIFTIRAIVRSRVGAWPAALADIAAADRIAHHASKDPIFIGGLVHIASERIALIGLNALVMENGRNPLFVAAAEKTLAAFGRLPNFRRSVGGEVVMIRQEVPYFYSWEDLNDQSKLHKPSDLERRFMQSSFEQDSLNSAALSAYRELYRVIPVGVKNWRRGLAEVQALTERIESDKSPENSVPRILFPSYSEGIEAVGALIEVRRLTAVSLRLCAVRNASGRYPQALPHYDELSIDPFTDKPFHYRPEPGGQLLYGVGPDGIDHGGKSRGTSGDSHDELIHLR